MEQDGTIYDIYITEGIDDDTAEVLIIHKSQMNENDCNSVMSYGAK